MIRRRVAAADPGPSGRLPGQVSFIIANGACERFAYYGTSYILTSFLAAAVLRHLPEAEREAAAVEIFHVFVIAVFFFPLMGGWLSDRFLGKFRAILCFNLVYSAGHGCLALFVDDRTGFFAGLFLIALGAGGNKPLVSSFIGDQFDRENMHRARVAFDAFYWSSNFGPFFASLLMPICLRDLGPRVAFGAPGALMLLATLVFWAGRRRYVIVPPARPDPHSFLRVARSALIARAPGQGRPGLALALGGIAAAAAAFLLLTRVGFVAATCLALVLLLGLAGTGAWLQLDRARAGHPDAAIEGVRAVLRLLIVFGLVTPFWSLFHQQASTWVLTAADMTRPDWFVPAQMQVLNPALVMLLIPFNNLVLLPALRRHGREPTPLGRMAAGIAAAGLAWVSIGIMQVVMDAGTPLAITWQVLPYAFLSLGEVLVSATGLEFAYSQAPPSMKGVIMSFWYLGITVGNLWVLLANATVRNHAVLARIRETGASATAFQMFSFAAFAFVAAIAFALCARRYKMADHYGARDGRAPAAVA